MDVFLLRINPFLSKSNDGKESRDVLILNGIVFIVFYPLLLKQNVCSATLNRPELDGS